MASRGKPVQTKVAPKNVEPKNTANKVPPKQNPPDPAPAPPMPPPPDPEPVQPPPAPPEVKEVKDVPEEEPRRKSSNQFGNLLPHVGSDHWDEDLIPEWLCCQVHAEMLTPPSSSEESYDSHDSKGKIVRKRRKKIRAITVEETEEEFEEEEELEVKYRTPSLPDVILEGWLNKGKLRHLTLQQIQSAINKLNDEIELIQIENLVFDRTVKKMEKREIEIEAALPPFTYKFPWEIEGAAKGIEVKTLLPDAICGELSDDEPDPPDGIYRPYIPAEDPEIDHEAIAAMLTVGGEDSGGTGGEGGEGHMSGVSVTRFLESFGQIPPPNFDVIRHKYGDLVRFATYDIEEGQGHTEDPLIVGLFHNKENGHNKTLTHNAEIAGSDDEMSDNEEHRQSHDLPLDISALEIPLGDFEEDPEFPGFNPHDAKRLPIGEKIKYAQIEEESIRNEFFKTETEGIQQENSIQVYVDTYTDSYDLSVKMMDAFKAVVANGIHHLTGKMRAEKIRRFRDKLKKRFLEEEAKVKIKLTENMKKKRRVDKQLKVAQDIGGTIQMIDYENLRVQNFEFQASIEDQQNDLKKLKYITGEWFAKLERNKEKLSRLLSKRNNLDSDIALRGNLKNTLYTSVDKSLLTAEAVTNHCGFLKKRLLAFSAPSTLEYINQKSFEHRLEDEVDLLKNKLDIMTTHLGKARQSFNRLLSIAPDKSAMRQTTETWLQEIKQEVKEKDLMKILDDGTDSLTDFVNYKTKRRPSDLQGIRRGKSIDFYTESTQSSLYLGGMTQSVMELYKVGKEKKRLSRLRQQTQEKLTSK